MMKTENCKISTEYRGVTLEGTLTAILPYAYTVTMEKPYRGLSKGECFLSGRGTFTLESIEGRATWELCRLFEQFESIRQDYGTFKNLYSEWLQTEKRTEKLYDEIEALRQDADEASIALIDLFQEALEASGRFDFEELIGKYNVIPLSLSPSVLEVSLRIIENENVK